MVKEYARTLLNCPLYKTGRASTTLP